MDQEKLAEQIFGLTNKHLEQYFKDCKANGIEFTPLIFETNLILMIKSLKASGMPEEVIIELVRINLQEGVIQYIVDQKDAPQPHLTENELGQKTELH